MKKTNAMILIRLLMKCKKNNLTKAAKFVAGSTQGKICLRRGQSKENYAFYFGVEVESSDRVWGACVLLGVGAKIFIDDCDNPDAIEALRSWLMFKYPKFV